MGAGIDYFNHEFKCVYKGELKTENNTRTR